MFLLINNEIRQIYESIRVPGTCGNPPKVVYAESETALRKALAQYDNKQFPIFWFRKTGVRKMTEAANFPMVHSGASLEELTAVYDPGDLPPAVKLLPVLVEYDLNILSDDMTMLDDFMLEIMFAGNDINQEDQNKFCIQDPEYTDFWYFYWLTYADNLNINREGDEYNVGYRFGINTTMEVEGYIRKLQAWKQIKHINVDLYLGALHVTDETIHWDAP